MLNLSGGRAGTAISIRQRQLPELYQCLVEIEGMAEALGNGRDHFSRRRDHFRANAVAGEQGEGGVHLGVSSE